METKKKPYIKPEVQQLLPGEAIQTILNKFKDDGTTLYSVQYQDYEQDEWTIPVLLTGNRVDQIISDASIKTIKLFYNDKTIFLVP